MKTLLKMAKLMGMLTLATMSGCDGGDTTSDQSSMTAGISGNGVAIGPVATFGSIVVNGVHYDTTNTTFMIDGNVATELTSRLARLFS